MIEGIQAEPSFVRTRMFGCEACYLHGRLVLVLATRRKEPWQGVLIPTEKEFHESLALSHEGLIRHCILGKWLYLPQSYEHFEETALCLTKSILENDPRIGVRSSVRRRRV